MTSATISTITPLADAGLSEKEIRLLASAWLSSSSTDLDIDKFAAIAGYPSALNARKRLGEAKNKARAKIFGAGSSAGGSVTAGNKSGEGKAPSTPKTPKRAPKASKSAPKRKGTASGDTSAGSDESPPKRGRTLKREDDNEAPQKTEESTGPSEVPLESGNSGAV